MNKVNNLLPAREGISKSEEFKFPLLTLFRREGSHHHVQCECVKGQSSGSLFLSRSLKVIRARNIIRRERNCDLLPTCFNKHHGATK